MIGRLLDGRYQVRSRIARGGMATVYLATDLRLERRVAIKIMHGHLADDSQFKERFIQEARSAARLAHPNVVNVFDQGQDSDMAYLVMEYLPGITLRDLLQDHNAHDRADRSTSWRRCSPVSPPRTRPASCTATSSPRTSCSPTTDASRSATSASRAPPRANTATGAALLGTIAYLSPELVTRGIADARSDIYAVGIMMYEMLAGEQPFKGEQPMQIAYQHANDSVPAPSAKNPARARELDELVLWATAQRPGAAPADARRDARPCGPTSHSAGDHLGRRPGRSPRSSMRASVGDACATTSPRSSAGDDQNRSSVPAPRRRRRDGPRQARREAPQAQPRGRRDRSRIVLVLAVARRRAGWYFGAGPGSHVTVPESPAGMSRCRRPPRSSTWASCRAEDHRRSASPSRRARSPAAIRPRLDDSGEARLDVTVARLARARSRWTSRSFAGHDRGRRQSAALGGRLHAQPIEPAVRRRASRRAPCIDAPARPTGAASAGVGRLRRAAAR